MRLKLKISACVKENLWDFKMQQLKKLKNFVTYI